MTRTHLLLSLGLLLTLGAPAQNWELTTPIKNRSDLLDLRMTGTTTGYVVDRTLGTILHTTDAGVHWQRAPQVFQANTLKSLWMFDDQRGIAGDGLGQFRRTTDGFQTLTSINPAQGGIECMHFLNDLVGLAGTSTGNVLRTTDGGLSWTGVASGTGTIIRALHHVDADLVFGATQTGMMRSTDGGLTWTQLTVPQVVNIFDLHFFSPLVGVGVGAAGHILRTTDGGDTWALIPTGFNWSFLALEFTGSTLVACGMFGRVARSTDAGATWTIEQYTGKDHLSLSHRNGVLVMCSEGAVYRSLTNGQTWEEVHLGTPVSLLNKVSFGTAQMGAAVGYIGNGGAESTLIRSADGGRSWRGPGSTSGGVLGVHLRADGVGVAGGNSGGHTRTTDFFATTTPGQPPSVAIRATWAFTNTRYVVAGGSVNSGLYHTTNGGATWTHTPGANIFDIHFPSDLVGYACGEGGVMRKTVDGGVSWSTLTSPVANDQFTVFFIDELRGWIGGATSGARTTDGGATWTLMTNIPSFTKAIVFTDADTGYAVGQTGQTLRSTDGGITWENILLEIPNAILGDAAWVDGALVAVGRFGDTYRAQLGCPLSPPVPTVFQVGLELCTEASAGVQWFLNEEPFPGGNTPCITAEAAGSYTVITTDLQGCVSASSEPVVVIATAVEGTTPSIVGVVAYPNPGAGGTTVQRTDGQPLGPVRVLASDGRMVHTTQGSGSSTVLQLPDPGLYLVQLADGAVLRVVVE